MGRKNSAGMQLEQKQLKTATDRGEERVSLAGALARFVKLTSLLPPTNERVRKCAEAVLSEVSSTLEDRLAVVMQINLGRLLVDGRAEDSEYDPSLRWFTEHMERAGVAAVELRPTVTCETLLKFGQRLVENGNNRRPEVLFCDLWPEEYPGIKLIERCYDGAFPVAAGDRGEVSTLWRTAGRQGRVLAELLESRPELSHRIMRLQALIDQAESKDESRGERTKIDLVGRIVNLFPADAMVDPSRIAELADALLSKLTRAVEQPGEGVGDISVNHMLLRLGREYFFREQPAKQRREDSPPVGARRRSAKPDLPVEKLLASIERLGEADRDPTGDLICDQEQVGVLLHFLGRTRDEDLADRLVGLLVVQLAGVDNDCRDLVREFVKGARARFAVHQQPSLLDRIAALLLDPSLSALAAESGLFEAARMIDLFPAILLPYLDAMNPDDTARRLHLESVCRSLGSERMLGSGEQLLRAGGFGVKGRAGKLLTHPSRTLLPLIHLILLEDSSRVVEVVKALRGLKFDLPESEPLRLFEDVRQLPVEYLLKLSAGAGSQTPELTESASRLLARIAADDQCPDDKRLFAISLLGVVQSEPARETLRALVRARRYLLMPAEPAGIRKTARHALARYGGGGD